MELSDTTTNYLILKARTNSDWDECDFAIVQVDEDWIKKMKTRFHRIQQFRNDHALLSMEYYDTSVEFYKDDNENMPDSEKFRNEKQWSFLQVSQQELEALSLPENSLHAYRLTVKKDGYASYSCYGKHTDDKFWTEEFYIPDIIQQM